MRIWPGRAPEGSPGKRAAGLRLVSAQHSDRRGDTPTRRAAAALRCASQGAPAAWLQPR